MMAGDARRLAAALSVAALALWLSAPVRAAAAAGDEGAADLLRANSLARKGRCDQALELLAQSGARNAQAALLRGQCHVDGKRWAEAITALDEALRLDPKLSDAQLPLAIARYQVGDLEGAGRALESVPPNARQRSEYHLYRGLLLLGRAQNEQAGESFDRARELAPTELAPIAAYYSGVAWLSAQDRARADAAFDRAIALAPGSEWAKQAEIARRGIVSGPPARWAWIRVGAEWDSNVVLRGEGVDVPGEFGNGSDGRAVWVAHAGAELWKRGAAAFGLSGTYYGSAHFELTDFDEHHPVLSPWFDYRIDEATLFRLRYDVGYSWIDEEEFLFSQQLSPTLFHDWGGKRGTSQLSVRVAYLDYLFPIGPDEPEPPFLPGVNEHEYRDRDGWGYGATLEHAIPFGRDSAVYAGVSYIGFASDGKEYDFNGGELFTGIETLLPGQIALRGVAGVGYFPFVNPSSYFDPPGVANSFEPDDREDVAFRVRIELERALGAGFSLLGRYFYVNRMSNVDVYDYDRHVVGLYVTYAL